MSPSSRTSRPRRATSSTAVTIDAIRAIRKASSPHGFNVGLNLGSAAGGSLAAHLHQHVVPRWGGDANFATVIGGVKVMPQLLAETREVLVEAWSSSGPATIEESQVSDGTGTSA